jgi:hypothetical protein
MDDFARIDFDEEAFRKDIVAQACHHEWKAILGKSAKTPFKQTFPEI